MRRILFELKLQRGRRNTERHAHDAVKSGLWALWHLHSGVSRELNWISGPIPNTRAQVMDFLIIFIHSVQHSDTLATAVGPVPAVFQITSEKGFSKVSPLFQSSVYPISVLCALHSNRPVGDAVTVRSGWR